jgi:hypothetical protein
VRFDRRTDPHRGGIRTVAPAPYIAAAACLLAFGGFAIVDGRLLVGQPPVWNART